MVQSRQHLLLDVRLVEFSGLSLGNLYLDQLLLGNPLDCELALCVS